MAEKELYDKISLSQEVQRYQTSAAFLELLYKQFNGADRLLAIGAGARLITTLSAMANELHVLDVNQGSIDRAREMTKSWRMYKDIEPLKREFNFLAGKGRLIRLDNCHFYLNDIPKELNGTFDGELAAELFLHLTEEEIKTIVTNARQHLKPTGRFVFTVYVTGERTSLDNLFADLGTKIGLGRREFIKDGVVDITTLAEQLKARNPALFKESKEKYWLDLERVRAFSRQNIEDICNSSGFKIVSAQNINCGMFPDAHRLVYVLN